MRVMLDTNVLISMVLFPGERFGRMLEGIIRDHTLVLSSFVVEELLVVVERKFPTRKDAIEKFLSNLDYELVLTPHVMPPGLFAIRDMKDYPVLYSAIAGGIDILVTGDKDFAEVVVDKPKILTPSEFIKVLDDVFLERR